MKKKLVVSFLLLIFSISLAFAANCGDGFCDAGQNIDPSTIEDSSTCYEDCGLVEYSICEIDSNTGGTCTFQGETYTISNVEFQGCGGTSESSMDFSISSGGNSFDFEIVPESWVSVIDNLQISVKTWPCAVFTSKKSVIFKSSSTNIEGFLEASKTDINLKKDNQISFSYSVPSWISEPYCKSRVQTSTGLLEEKIITSRETSGCNLNPFYLGVESLSAGRYLVFSEVFDNKAENKLGEESIQLIVNECESSPECSDGKFYTKDICVQSSPHKCSNETNYSILILLGIILIILFILFRRKK